MKKYKYIKYISGAALLAFALLTLFLSTSVIFDLFGIREKEGNYVLFVVVSNFISSLLYLTALVGWFQGRKWSYKPMLGALGVLIAAQIFFLNHIKQGGIYEERTIGAMFFRIVITLIFTTIIYYLTKKMKRNEANQEL